VAARAEDIRGDRATRADRTLVITRVFNAPRSLVFKLWTDPAHLVRWWGPKGMTLVSSELDIKPGGATRRVLRSESGELCVKRGLYREIVEPERLVFTYADEDADGRLGPETLVTVTFAEEGNKTRLTLHQALFETKALCDGHRKGWTGALERLAEYLQTI